MFPIITKLFRSNGLLIQWSENKFDLFAGSPGRIRAACSVLICLLLLLLNNFDNPNCNPNSFMYG